MSDDPIELAHELERQILAVPEDQIFTKRVVTIAFSVIASLLVLLLAAVLWVAIYASQTAKSTNHAVKGQITVLQERNTELVKKDAALEDVTSQLTDALVASQKQVRSLGGTPPDVVIRSDKEKK